MTTIRVQQQSYSNYMLQTIQNASVKRNPYETVLQINADELALETSIVSCVYPFPLCAFPYPVSI